MSYLQNETQLVCVARFTAKDGEVDKLLKNLHGLIRLTTQEGGCLRYELNQNIEDKNDITFIEKWYDKETFDAHCAKDYLIDFFKGGKPDHTVAVDVSLHKELLPSL